MISLTPPQRETLHGFMCVAFDVNTLPIFVRLRFGQRLDQMVDLSKPFPNVVLGLLENVEQAGGVESLIKVLVSSFPSREDLIAFCKSDFPRILDLEDSTQLIRSVKDAVVSISTCLSDPHVRQIVGRFQADFRTLESQISILARYKQLHEVLHVLQKQLPSLVDAAKRFPHDVSAVKQLNPARLSLDQQVLFLRTQANGLPTEHIENDWIRDLEDAATTTKTAWMNRDTTQITVALNSIRILFQELPRIDGQLSVIVGAVQLEKLLEALGMVSDRIEDKETRPQLEKGIRAISMIRPELRALVSQHNDWQWLDKELAGIETNPGTNPIDRVPRWDRVKERLKVMCAAFIGEKWTDSISGHIDGWEKASAAILVLMRDQSDNEQEISFIKDTCEIEADSLRALAMNHFFEVDRALRSLSEELLQIGMPLKILLEAYTNE